MNIANSRAPWRFANSKSIKTEKPASQRNPNLARPNSGPSVGSRSQRKVDQKLSPRIIALALERPNSEEAIQRANIRSGNPSLLDPFKSYVEGGPAPGV
jgi:hypothetical protein